MTKSLLNNQTRYEPGDLDCPYCHGAGIIFVDEQTVKQCVCAFRRAIRARLGDEIIAAEPVLGKSPLFDPGVNGEVSVDRSEEDLFIKCWWRDFKSHFRLVAANKLERFSFQWRWVILTDERIKSVFVGSEAYASKSRKKRDDVETYNSLADIIGDTFDLAVIRLGFLGYKNAAMAGALREALLIRQAANKPTWILEEPDSVFGPNHFSWSRELEEYITARYQQVNLVGFKEESMPPVDTGMVVENCGPKVPSRPQPTFSVPRVETTKLTLDPILVGTKKKGNKGHS